MNKNKFKKMFSSKGGQLTLGSLPNVILTLVFVGAIALGGFLAFDGMTATVTAGSYADNATSAIEQGLDNTFDQMPTIGTLIGVGILLTVVVLGFGAARQRGIV